MVFTKGLAYDVGYWEYRDPGMTIRIYAGVNAPQVTDRNKQFADYSETVTSMNEYPALITKYKDRSADLRNVYAARIGSTTNIDSYSLTIVFKSEQESLAFAEKLFSSALFESTIGN